MKKYLFIVLCVISINLFGQFTDNFTDGDYTNSPVWTDDSSKFEVLGNELHLNDASLTDPGYIYTASQAIDSATWEFYIRMEFSPSSSNYCKAYLVSNSTNLSGSLNGYFVQIGGISGSLDDISLYRQDGTGTTEIINGRDATVGGAQVVAKIKVTRDSLGNWELFSDTNTTGTYISEGTVNDMTYSTTSYFGFECIYTSTRADKFYFDSINVTGYFAVDITAPKLNSVTVLSDTSIDLYFDENVEQVTAETIGNYLLDGSIGNPSSVTIDGSNKSLVHIIFSTAMTNGTDYTLTVTNVEDENGNPITSEQINFTYFIPSYRDIIFTEIFADPTPSVGMPQVEYLEIYNNSGSTIDLKDWELSDGSNTTTLSTYSLSPGEYLILSPSATDSFSTYGNVLDVSSWPSLNNSGDFLSLKSSLGTLIDTVPYTDSWYNSSSKADGGYSLELIDPNFPCINSLNWTATSDTTGGTPGKVNSVNGSITDSQAPFASSSELTADSILTLSFDEQIEESSINKNNFSIDNGLVIDTVIIGSDGSSIKVIFTTAITKNIIYTLTFSDIQDCIGNTSSSQDIEFGQGLVPSAGELVINEIFPDPSPSVGLPESEFVEIYNTSSNILDLGGLSFTDQNDTLKIDAYTILPGEYLILSSDESYSVYGKLFKGSLPGLNNSGETLQLLDANGAVYNSVTYNTDFYNDVIKEDGGWTMELKNVDNICGTNYAANWGASVSAQGGTPGMENSIAGTLVDVDVPELVRVYASSENTLSVYFSEAINPSTIELTDYSINNGISVVSRGLTSALDVDNLIISPGLQPKTSYTLQISGISDCSNNDIQTASFTFGLPESAESGDLLINEILFNPRTGGKDFVEFYNNSDKFIDLTDMYFIEYDDTTIDASSMYSDNLVVNPQGFVVLTEDKDNIIAEYPNAVSENIYETDIPSYNDSEGDVIIGLNDSAIVVTDSFHYDKDMHFELLDDLNGVSLERIDYSLPTSDVNNWHSAASTVGYATPGYVNSQNIELSSSENNFIIEPEIFTPDDDGMNDFTMIRYNFDEPGYVANITIFDSYGRLVRELVRNDILGLEGNYQWDGMNEENRKVLVGNYVVLFSIFDVDGNSEKFKKIVSVGAQF